MSAHAYVPAKAFASLRVDLRGMSHHVLTWGDPKAPKLFLLHGWMDVGASFQFMVDALQQEWHVIAPDLRGFGGTEWQPQGYWFADYLADLEALLDRVAPGERVNIAGHSLGGNVVLLYAGVRPDRVARVVSLDAFGIRPENPDVAPAKIARWLDALKQPIEFKSVYRGLDAVAAKLRKKNPRLSPGRAAFLAGHWAEALAGGGARLRSDPRHKLPFPSLYRIEEAYAIWRRITAPTLWIAAEASHNTARLVDPPPKEPAAILAIVRERLAHIPHAELATIADAGHMLHHDQPEAVARVLERFLER